MQELNEVLTNRLESLNEEKREIIEQENKLKNEKNELTEKRNKYNSISMQILNVDKKIARNIFILTFTIGTIVASLVISNTLPIWSVLLGITPGFSYLPISKHAREKIAKKHNLTESEVYDNLEQTEKDIKRIQTDLNELSKRKQEVKSLINEVTYLEKQVNGETLEVENDIDIKLKK